MKNISQEVNLVKNGFDKSDEIKFLTKISCYTVSELMILVCISTKMTF